jgi:hypothetical protein
MSDAGKGSGNATHGRRGPARLWIVIQKMANMHDVAANPNLLLQSF